MDIEAPPPSEEPTAHVVFGTNQVQPIDLVAERYHQGLAPLIIATGGVNRHTGIVEGRWFHELLSLRGVPDQAIRVEDRSSDTEQNVEFSLAFIREALSSGLAITAVSKWYHRRTLHALKTRVPEIGAFYGLSWEPVYAGRLVTRAEWPRIPDGERRVVREWDEVRRRVADGSLQPVQKLNGVWS
ncbi:YdcF family protein [Actinomadura barringtoniae]|uniref:YdcF family protein n=1 Tax=Actinomadura barringtoniae TaxID=1427535 RepID=A0A939PRI8_9ACTN|nr:YdcF family protein [Actinomadura barringtoniae]MBO2454889.1 YdcF family protein [Actinomadura barringtoniae]